MPEEQYEIIEETRKITRKPIAGNGRKHIPGYVYAIKIIGIATTIIGLIVYAIDLYHKVNQPVIRPTAHQLPQINSIQGNFPEAIENAEEKKIKVEPERKPSRIEERRKVRQRLKQPRGPSYHRKHHRWPWYHRTYDSRRLYERWYDY